VHGVAGDHVIRRAHGVKRVSRDTDAVLAPYAQSEMVHAFMQGVEPGYQQVVETTVMSLVKSYPDLLGKTLTEVTITAPARTALQKASEEMLDAFASGLAQYRQEIYTNPVLAVVASLPKDELAAMAEALVNLTWFKRRVTMEAETVGGPIDVAVVTKGDGVVWIKRKLYFPAALNPQYFGRRTVRSEADGVTET
jgi:hypothetical protein